MTLINKVGVSHIHFSTILSHTLGTRIYMSDFVYNCEHTRKTAWTTTIYTKTSQVTVGQLHCFEINPLGTFSTFDAPDPCTFARSNCWKPFSLQSFEFQTVPLWIIEHLHQETSSTKTPSTSKAISLLPWKKSSKYFAIFRRALRQA